MQTIEVTFGNVRSRLYFAPQSSPIIVADGAGGASWVPKLTFLKGAPMMYIEPPDADHLQLRIEGTMTNPRFRGHITQIRGSFASVFSGSFEEMFSQCTIDFIEAETPTNPILLNTSNAEGMFQGARSPIGNFAFVRRFDTSRVTNMAAMFYGAETFNQDISLWNTENVTDMSWMFCGAISFNQAIGLWNTPRVSTMSSMFEGAIAFNQDLNRWNTSRVRVMSGMFYKARSFNGNISEWDVSGVEDFHRMFCCATAFNQSIVSWRLDHALCVEKMLQDATSFNQDLRAWGRFEIIRTSPSIVEGATAFDHERYSPLILRRERFQSHLVESSSCEATVSEVIRQTCRQHEIPEDQPVDDKAADDHQCVVCYAFKPQIECRPCGHQVLCGRCAIRLTAFHDDAGDDRPPRLRDLEVDGVAKCPMCRGPITEIRACFL